MAVKLAGSKLNLSKLSFYNPKIKINDGKEIYLLMYL
jgi:hypothetical protein